MINESQIASIAGTTVHDSDGDKIGKAGQVYLDDSTGSPSWVTVNTGLFGTSESFVPLEGAGLEGSDLRVAYQKSKVKDAPKVAADGHLDVSEEEELYRYYGLGGAYDTMSNQTTDTTGTTGTVTETSDRVDDTRDDNRHGTVGHDTSGPTTDDAMTRSEEHLVAGTQRSQAGRALLRKYVTTEQQSVTVPVSHEEAVVTREPITEANRDNALAGPSISEEEHEVDLQAERAVVSTEATPVERVRLDKQTVTEQQTVSGEVRKEQIELDDDSSATDSTRGR